ARGVVDSDRSGRPADRKRRPGGVFAELSLVGNWQVAIGLSHAFSEEANQLPLHCLDLADLDAQRSKLESGRLGAAARMRVRPRVGRLHGGALLADAFQVVSEF